MISNAKSFNSKASQIFSDAEKIRKLVSNFMVDRNPAYRDKNYVAVATPVPDGWKTKAAKKKSPVERHLEQPLNEGVKLENTPGESRSGRRSGRNPASTPATEESDRRASSTPAVQDAEGAGESFEGNTFQQAQDKIVTEMINLTDDQ